MKRPYVFRRRIGEQHFAIAGFCAFVVFAFGAVLMALFALGAEIFSDVDCKWNPQTPRCTLLAERGGW